MINEFIVDLVEARVIALVLCSYEVSMDSLLFGLQSSYAGLPQPGKNIWKMKFFQGQGIL